MKKYCIIANDEKDLNYQTAEFIKNYIEQRNGRCILVSEERKDVFYTDVSKIPKDTECAIVLGGDGTMIQAAKDLVHLSIPIFGINMGTLGFLTEAEPQHMESALNKLLSGEYRIESRMMLSGEVVSEDTISAKDIALNDIVISRSGFSRLIRVKISVNNEPVNIYSGDGVIISTPTGSTGYNLSAGGPIAIPISKIMMITPICPHSLISRSIVVSTEDKIRVEIEESKKTQEEEAIVTIDGRTDIKLKAGDYIEIQRAEVDTKLIRINNMSFFEVLRSKLGEERD